MKLPMPKLKISFRAYLQVLFALCVLVEAIVLVKYLYWRSPSEDVAPAAISAKVVDFDLASFNSLAAWLSEKQNYAIPTSTLDFGNPFADYQ